MSGPGDYTTGPPDRQTLRLLERVLGSDPLVTATAFEPDSYEPHALGLDLDSDRFPPAVEGARLDVRWFTSGDFSFHYVEQGEHRWECRWDQHPNDHNARIHFHQPPDAKQVTDLSLDSRHPLAVASTVLAAVRGRIEHHWN